MRKKRFTSSHASLLDPDEILADSISALNAGGTAWERKIEKPIAKISSVFFLSVIFIGMGYLVWRAASLQLAHGNEFYEKSQENRFITRSVFPPRGILYDKNHEALVQNIASFGIVFNRNSFFNAVQDRGRRDVLCARQVPSRASDAALQKNTAPLAASSACASARSRVDFSEELRTMLVLLGTIMKKDNSFFADLGFPDTYSFSRTPGQLVIARDIPIDMIAEISARRDALPGIEVIESYRREYLDSYAMSHLVGFIGKISDEDLRNNPAYHFEESVGKDGLEQFYDAKLRGTAGKKIVEVDSKGKETRFRLSETPTAGASLLLSIDGILQQMSYDLLKNYTNGTKGASAVVMDVRTGAIRALVSFPGFDSDKISSGMSNKEFQQLLGNRLSPLFSRSIAGEFPSGSVIKPLFAAAALQEKIIDPRKKIYDPGFIEIPNPYHPGESSIFKDWKVHGWVDFYDAIANSADVYFYMIGGGFGSQKGLGIERLKKYAAAFGLGDKLGIDMPGERPGSFPDPALKAAENPKDPIWRVGDTYNTSIGQGGVKVTPLQITDMIAAIANGGTLYRPRVLDAVLDEEGNVVERMKPEVIRDHLIDPEYLEQSRIGMRQTVTAGTARSLGDLPFSVAAKTGTAETGINPHAWFVAFAPYDKPEIAVTVMVEHGGEGSSIAAPITKEILKWYFSRHDAPVAGRATTTPVVSVAASAVMPGETLTAPR